MLVDAILVFKAKITAVSSKKNVSYFVILSFQVGTLQNSEHFVEIRDRFHRVAYEQLLSTLRASVRDSKDEYFSAFPIK